MTVWTKTNAVQLRSFALAARTAILNRIPRARKLALGYKYFAATRLLNRGFAANHIDRLRGGRMLKETQVI